jgi:hypothetical protein
VRRARAAIASSPADSTASASTAETVGPTGSPSTPTSANARSHDAISSTQVSGVPKAMSRRASTIGEIDA